MVAAAGHDSLEVDPLKLSKTQFPIPATLQSLVRQQFADPARSAQGDQAMRRDELITYIRASARFDLRPLEAVLAQTEQIGDPALPAPEDSAVLAWIGASCDYWEKHHPLDEAVSSQLRRLQPVIALIALADAQFYTPGKHPLHQTLDALQAAAVGWQDGLGRAGEPLLKLIDETVEGALASLEADGEGLISLLRNSTRSAQRLQTRQQRMAQRAADVERGQLRAARARNTAAAMINQQLQRFPIPAEIGQFITGPWYESAQLVLLKFGEQAEQWRDFVSTTASLLDALQPPGDTAQPSPDGGIGRRLSRWLLSLQHDPQAAEQAISNIEYAHLRVARGEDVQRANTTLLAADDKPASNGEVIAEVEALEMGQWFLVQARKGSTLRIQLAMKQDDEQRLLFCNHAGARVQAMDYSSFARLLSEGKAVPLSSDNSFSRALAAVVGIDNQEALAKLTGQPPSEGEQAATAGDSPAPDPGAGDPLPPLEVESEEPRQPDLPDSGVPELPMGTWLGFHDVDPPLLAKLALHDKVRQLFIFVNRKGVEQRRLGEDEYLALIQAGQVDILETKVNFREQVERARDRMKRHQR
ncbi:DUF1631 family protein [Seongchinamella unica]|uniref:DUF1631 family protein n=1 Tax=Seongchinamella unica TaxID=2547392 RepID=A0A4R5LPS8_9GAMM|nr:DUF1631 family protein [Seongchinamella unica]TDG12562.1 DUF1631 family protein [Seongchinamella unica]